ncbi:MAG: S8 family serine peptidase [Flavobacteriaceae bacterium]|nr:S8 family serine peptidase [Flavobacteriaceae bacterium]
MKKIISFFCILAVYTAFSQTAQERKKISTSYNSKKVEQTRQDAVQWEREKKDRVAEYFSFHKEERESFKKDGVSYQAVDISSNGQVIYRKTSNQGSSATIKANSLNTGGSLGLDINGENMRAGVWDEGVAMPNHADFPDNKINLFDGTTTISEHSTHVAGTIVGAGNSPKMGSYPAGRSKGLAYKATIDASNWDNDISEMTQFAQGGGLASNHSYGLSVVNDNGTVNNSLLWLLGAYDSDAFYIDRVAYNAPKYQISVAAGNDRDILGPALGSEYGITSDYGNAKNSLTVGAVYELTNYTQPSNVLMTSFSCYGPTDDGRIKPNLVAKGRTVYSAAYNETNPSNTSFYESMSGTSMATPAITASVILLQQYYNSLNGNYARSATVRGLLQHTAMEAGANDGPDYGFGWGLVNLEKSAVAISGSSLKKGAVIEENTLNDGATYTKQVKVVSTSEPLIISISWTDPPYNNYNKGTTNPTTKYLINDLDVQVTAPDGTIYYPWKLDGANPVAAATNNSTNDVDNFERVDIKNPVVGTYTITISHKESLKTWVSANPNTGYQTGSQDYTLIVTSPDATMSVEDVNAGAKSSSKIYPIPAKNILNVSTKKSGSYTIYTLTGGAVKSGKLNGGVTTLNISDLKKGVYILKLADEETHKIIVE